MALQKDATLLLVDDDHGFRQLVRYELEKEGYSSILEAEDGDEALNLIREKHVDLLLLDLRMPRLQGEEVLRVVKENHPSIGVIVVTGRTESSVRKSVLELGAEAYFEKPYDSAELFSSISRVLSSKEKAKS